LFLQKYKPSTPTLRFKKNVFKFYYNFTNFKKFFFKIKNKSGRSKYGYKLLRSRLHNKYNKTYSINYNNIYFDNLSIITSINYLSKNNCFLGLIKNSNNSVSYIKLIDGLYIGSYIKLVNKPLKVLFNLNNLLGSFMFLCYTPQNSIVSNLINHKSCVSKIAKSSGTYLSIFNSYVEFNIYILVLPSGFKKIFSGYSKILLGRNSNILNKNICYGKAGVTNNNG
jgi:ribosomal protein L2